MKVKPSKNDKAVSRAVIDYQTDLEMIAAGAYSGPRGIVNANALGIGANPRRAKRKTKPVIAKRERMARGCRYARGVWPCSLSVLS